MAKVTMTLEGMDALKRAVTESPNELKRFSSDVIRRTTWAIADRMRKRVPVREGILLGAINSTVPSTRGLNGAIRIDGDAYYWRYLEYGTRKMAARPFVRPSTEEESGPFVAGFRDVGKRLERFWAGR